METTLGQLHKSFIEELTDFVNKRGYPGQVISTYYINQWLKKEPKTHPVFSLYRKYILSRNRRGGGWDLDDYSRVGVHMKYLDGYFTKTTRRRKDKDRIDSKMIPVKRHYIRIKN